MGLMSDEKLFVKTTTMRQNKDMKSKIEIIINEDEADEDYDEEEPSSFATESDYSENKSAYRITPRGSVDHKEPLD